MDFREFLNSPQIQQILRSNNPYAEMEKVFGNNPMAMNVIRMAKNGGNTKQLEQFARNIYQEKQMDINQTISQLPKFGR